jgi:hypothetical protein
MNTENIQELSLVFVFFDWFPNNRLSVFFYKYQVNGILLPNISKSI